MFPVLATKKLKSKDVRLEICVALPSASVASMVKTSRNPFPSASHRSEPALNDVSTVGQLVGTKQSVHPPAISALSKSPLIVLYVTARTDCGAAESSRSAAGRARVRCKCERESGQPNRVSGFAAAAMQTYHRSRSTSSTHARDSPPARETSASNTIAPTAISTNQLCIVKRKEREN